MREASTQRVRNARNEAIGCPAGPEGASLPVSSKGRTGDFESPNHGSNPCTGTGVLSDRPAAEHKVGHKSERWARAAADDVAVPVVAAGPDVAAPTASTTSIRADIRRALAEGLTRALAAGDDKAARIAIVALSGLMDDALEAAPAVDAVVVDSMTARR